MSFLSPSHSSETPSGRKRAHRRQAMNTPTAWRYISVVPLRLIIIIIIIIIINKILFSALYPHAGLNIKPKTK